MLKVNIPKDLVIKSELVFEDTSTNKKFKYKVIQSTSTNDFYLNCNNGSNDIIFDYYKVEKYKFVDNIIGYETSRLKIFPETKTLEDLRKVCIALQYIDEY